MKMKHRKRKNQGAALSCNYGAEICELTGIYISLQLSNLVPQEDWLIPG